MCLDWTTVKLFEIISKLWRNSPTKHVMWIGENWLSWNGLYSLDWVLNNVTKLNIKERLWGWALVRCRSKLVFRWLQRNCIWNTKKTNLKVSGLYLYIHVFVESEFSMQYSCRHIQVTSMLNSFFFQLPKLPIICQAASGFSCGMSILIPLLLPLNFIPHRSSSYPSSIDLPFEIPLDLKFMQGFTQLELANCPLIRLLSKFRAKKSF